MHRLGPGSNPIRHERQPRVQRSATGARFPCSVWTRYLLNWRCVGRVAVSGSCWLSRVVCCTLRTLCFVSRVDDIGSPPLPAKRHLNNQNAATAFLPWSAHFASATPFIHTATLGTVGTPPSQSTDPDDASAACNLTPDETERGDGSPASGSQKLLVSCVIMYTSTHP